MGENFWISISIKSLLPLLAGGLHWQYTQRQREKITQGGKTCVCVCLCAWDREIEREREGEREKGLDRCQMPLG